MNEGDDRIMRYIVRTVDFDETRLKNVEILKEQIPNLEVYVDHDRDSYKSFLAVCDLVDSTGAVILEDDIKLCRNFCSRIERIISEKGHDKVYNFFEKPKTYFKTSYVGGSGFLWGQCIYFPSGLPSKMRKYYDEFRTTRPKKWQGMATDCLVGYVLSKERVKYWRIRPCLVQHLDYKSVIGNRPTNRQTPYFIDDLEERGLDYDSMEI
jgi:hypothetical protein